MARIIQTADLDRSSQLLPQEEDWIYNGLDCCVTLEVLHALRNVTDEVAQATYEFSLALQAPVLEMSLNGLRVDTTRRDHVVNGKGGFYEKLHEIESHLNRIVQEGVNVTGEFNWRSNAQVGQLLYDVMQLPEVKVRRGPRWVRTVERDAIEQLDLKYFIARPITSRLLALREIIKKIEFLETGIDSDDRFRASWNIAGTKIGRLSSSLTDFGTGRNLQNVDRSLRSVFIADPGYVFVNIDLEQADARNVGAICWDLFVESHGPEFAGAYLDACESGDLHTTVCQIVWPELDWKEGEFKHNRTVAEQMYYRQDSYRQSAKKQGHATNYLEKPKTAAKHAKIDVASAEVFQHNYFKAFPCVKLWQDTTIQTVKDEHVLTTLLGRRRHFFGRAEEGETQRQAVAYRPASMTADQIDRAMLQIWRTYPQVQILLQVHDSLLLQVRQEEVDTLIPKLVEMVTYRTALAQGRKFIVPAEAKVGLNWGEYNKKENSKGLQKWPVS